VRDDATVETETDDRASPREPLSRLSIAASVFFVPGFPLLFFFAFAIAGPAGGRACRMLGLM